MKNLPGLPAVGPGYCWEVEPSAVEGALLVTLWGPPGPLGLMPRLLARERTRAWPAPGAKQVIRAARKVARTAARREALQARPLIGRYPSAARVPRPAGTEPAPPRGQAGTPGPLHLGLVKVTRP